MNKEKQKKSSKKIVFIITIINTILSLLLLSASPGIMMANVMSGANSTHILGAILAIQGIILPVFPSVSIIFSWISYVKWSNRTTYIFIAIPWVYALIVSITLFLFFY